MTVTYYGHSCFLVNIDSYRLLFDPYITANPLASHINILKINADYIFLSHAHFDHVFDAVAIAQQTGAKVIANWEINAWLQKHGITNTQPMNPGGRFRFDFGDVKSTIAMHSSSFEDGTYGGVAGGFVISTRSGNFFYSGDTALTKDFKLINDFATLDFAIFPIGDVFTMGVSDAIRASRWLSVKRVLGVHYNTFEAIKIDKKKSIERFDKAGIKLDLPEIGESLNY